MQTPQTIRPSKAAVAFGLTYAGHFAIHVSRKAFAAAHGELENNWGFTGGFLGILDTMFMMVYGVGLLVSGYLAERMDPVLLISVGTGGAAASMILFAISPLIGISGSAYSWYIILMCSYAGFQSASMPCGVKLVDSWYPPSSHGKVFSIWATHAIAGNVAGLLLAALLDFLEGSASLLPLLLIPAGLLVFTGILQKAFIFQGPMQHQPVEREDAPQQEAIPLRTVLRLPWVRSYALAFAACRIVDVAVFFWVVLFLHENLNVPTSTAALIAMAYDAGLVTGSFLSGKLTDSVNSRPGVFATCLFAASLLASITGWLTSAAATVITIFILGMFMGGPIMLISTAIAAEISTKANLPVTATVVGILDGTGSFLAALGEIGVGFASDGVGWGFIFTILSFVLLIGSALCLYIHYGEKKDPLVDDEEDYSEFSNDHREIGAAALRSDTSNETKGD
ncbi:hypothetical protein AAMO2058_001256300 [Amorphochlora amoebiformis]|uniref:Major facilitator superfamily (MFS) profile domain-containing protein n=1 Tax=Amorphochlora amoebiformis TaxID=1561963 RepID=A0A7S0H3K7_9EUKA|mmetsp:Transcript_32902/g.52929  ORF Transcript_32902/g.52929 Transcript_32902/m.52929 type:complete len:452 (+) Transcript_32902:35-1390(+)